MARFSKLTGGHVNTISDESASKSTDLAENAVRSRRISEGVEKRRRIVEAHDGNQVFLLAPTRFFGGDKPVIYSSPSN